VFAPLAVSVILLPLQIVVDGETEIVGVGTGFTVTVLVAVATHPADVVPVNVYVVLAVGDMEIEEVLEHMCLLRFHLK
jgi:hypothetical protein